MATAVIRQANPFYKSRIVTCCLVKVPATSDSFIMADPYNPYIQYSTPTPGGVSYYPPEEQQTYQQHQSHPPPQPVYGYNTGEAQPEQNYTYAPQSSPYHLAPEPYQGYAPDRSYTPVGQPDYLGPVAAAGTSTGQGQKIPENLGY